MSDLYSDGPALTLQALLPSLARQIEEMLHWQIWDEQHPDHGAIYNADYGTADNKATSTFITVCAYLMLGKQEPDSALLDRLLPAADYLLRAQRPSGNIDLLSVNYDSAPDTGFTVQQLCTIFELGREFLNSHTTGEALLNRLETFIRRTVPGMMAGGFHTPNHRWVIVSALTQAKALFPDLEIAETVEAYLAEGIDIDAEGAFIERSVGVYDAVNNRSLLFIYENWDCPETLAAVQRSLDFDLYLLHADGTAETGLSRRQDYGTREVALGLAACYLHAHHLAPNEIFSQAAQWLSAKNREESIHLHWLAYALLKCGDPAPTEARLPDDYARHFPVNGVWRVRRGRLSASTFKGVTRLLTLVHGEAELSSIKISHTYFGTACGHFISDEMTVDGNRALLRSEGLGRYRRPGYELPLGRPVPPEAWEASFEERPLFKFPPLTSELAVEEVEGGFDLHLRTLNGLEHVAAQIAFDFPPGGVWETGDSRIMPQAGQVIFLKSGYGEMRYGSDAIHIGPGALAHGMWQMRDSELAPNHVRVLMTFWTPVDHRVQLRAGGMVDWLSR
jgi:hypothetical protein